nr:hypothetical protein [uncultured Bacteroides sp.]
MKVYFITIVFLLSLTSVYALSPVKWNSNLSTEQNIAANSIALKNATDLFFLNKIAREKSIIILGEPGHYELKTSEAKISIINYLKSKEFNSVAMETVSFISGYVFSSPEYKEKTKDWDFENMWSTVWTDQKTCKPIVEQINKREIKLLGIDSQLGYYDIDAVKIILEKYKDEFPIDIDWKKLQDYYISCLVFYMVPQEYKPLNKTEEYELMSLVNKIQNYTGCIISRNGNNINLKALLQWVQNVKNAYPYNKYNKVLDPPKNASEMTFATYIERSRDDMMAKNVIWYSINKPKEKFTVWCANYHASRDLSQVTIPYDSLLYFSTQTMGEFLSQNPINKKMYSLALISKNVYKGEVNGKLESEIAQFTNNAPFAFIDFASLRFAEGYWDKTFNVSIKLNRDGKYLYSYDGLYYIRDQELNYK